MELAKNDLNYKNEILRNKLNAMEIEIGISLLPLKTKIAELKLAAIDLVNTLTLGSNGDRNKGFTYANDKYAGLLQNAPAMNEKEFQTNLAEILLDIKQTERAWKNSDDWLGKQTKAITTAYLTKKEGLFGWNKVEAYLDFLKLPSGDTYAGMLTQLTGIKDEFIKTWKIAYKNKPSLTTPITPKGDKTDPNNPVTPPVSDGVGTVVGSARQIRNLTVNIEAFNKGGINTANTTLQHMEPNQIEEWFIDMCMRVVRSIETTY